MKVLKEALNETHERNEKVIDAVTQIVKDVREQGDKVIIDLAERFDGVVLESVKVSGEMIKDAYTKVEEETIEHLKFAASQIEYYARNQYQCLKSMEIKSDVEGVLLGHKLIPVSSCGCYIPGGRYPLPSSALMSIIPAKVAGVQKIFACCPASKEHGMIHPAVLVAMDIAGADEVYCMGGAQAIAAYTYGTEAVKKVDLIVGPGNQYVTEAKRQVIGEVGIDSLAGPSEVLIIADESANPEFVAVDLLAQSEHDPSAKATLVTTSEKLVEDVNEQLLKFIDQISTGKTAGKSWDDNGQIILVDSLNEAIEIANDMAPEHLEVHTVNDDEVSTKLINYGSLFIGSYTPVTFGDYVSGTNHILPTMRTARYSNGVWVGTFIKTHFYQKVSQSGCQNLSKSCMHIAGIEGLLFHQLSVAVRVK